MLERNVERIPSRIANSGTSTVSVEAITLRRGTTEASGRAEITLRLSPKPSVTFRATLEPTAEALEVTRNEGTLTAQLGERQPVEVVDIETTFSSHASCEMRLVPSRGPLTLRQTDGSLDRVDFHLLNFPSFLGPSDYLWSHDGKETRLGRLLLQDNDALVEIQQLEQTDQILKRLQENGGSDVTHVGRISSRSPEGLQTSTVQAVLRRLHRFMSFASGHWTAIIGVFGYDSTGDLTYEEWSTRLTDQWQGHSNWFDVHHGEWLEAVYPKFCDLFADDALGSAAEAALYWYLRSNLAGSGPGVDGGAILSHAALERLSNDLLLSRGKNPRRPAAQVIRQALDELAIPSDVPAWLDILSEGIRDSLWSDLPDAISRIRNDLVHPKQLLPTRPAAIVEAWKASQWLIEMMLLKMSGYEGQYSNRLRVRWVGETDPVPWTPAGPS